MREGTLLHTAWSLMWDTKLVRRPEPPRSCRTISPSHRRFALVPQRPVGIGDWILMVQLSAEMVLLFHESVQCPVDLPDLPSRRVGKCVHAAMEALRAMGEKSCVGCWCVLSLGKVGRHVTHYYANLACVAQQVRP